MNMNNNNLKKQETIIIHNDVNFQRGDVAKKIKKIKNYIYIYISIWTISIIGATGVCWKINNCRE